jgi:hypothetical protein
MRERLEKVAQDGMERLFMQVPQARDFHVGTWIDREYYHRHLVETVLRIRLNNEVDAYALYKIGYKDNRLAATLARYLAEEYGHEGMFLRDIARFGLTKVEVDAIRVFPSTEKLMGYLYFAINQHGPLPTMIWNWFVEWYSDRYNGVITNHAAETFGVEMVKGSQAHIQYDESHDHDELMWTAVTKAINGWGDYETAERYLTNFIDLIADYFTELYASTIAPGS